MSTEAQRAHRREYNRAWSRANRTSINATQRKWRAGNPKKTREYSRRYLKKYPEKVHQNSLNQRLRKHGLTQGDLFALAAIQQGNCAICGRDYTRNRGQFHIDHDHISGKVRGLLCGNCNNGIGMLNENPATLRRAAEYLEGV